ncbi:pseudaminic acid cytidylyltransferase [Salibacter halophilus]|uniref:Pseudaminic acid cytidylyltransferase n=1 Tax=Salibacter halophilus TaxID=1803916 RepID=A0A6N6M2W0_9FLAO|nr:pseudaminic acid cytidylyltransferase [Salibacter halophilus]KAB1063532.1 pseudaminic acid cytidylyltransferase [Salibacter halophilus]
MVSKQRIANNEQRGNLCIIPARGGSKRIPRKNIKDFLVKPIIAYSIEAALKSNLFEEVMISTDDEEIAKVAKAYGAKVPFMRSKENADDYATTLDVVKEVIASYKDLAMAFDNICILYPTAPFVTAARLKEGYDHLDTNNAAIPVTEFSFPVWRAFKIEAEQLAYQWPKHEKRRSQDLETLYHDAGQWYWIKTDSIQDTLVPKKTAPVVLNSMEVQDIDTIEDWELAELKFQKMFSKQES